MRDYTKIKAWQLADEFRNRTKKYAAEIIRLYVKLPKSRGAKQILDRRGI